MYIARTFVKTMIFAILAATIAATAFAAENTAQPHMMYFYNPSCRLCTRTNEIVGDVEEKYKNVMSSQRFNIADKDTGTDNVLYMFDLLDELEVPDEGNITLIVFLGLLEKENGEYFFIPKRVLVEGDDIIAKLDRETADFLAKEGKGVSLGLARPASFFLQHRPGFHPAG